MISMQLDVSKAISRLTDVEQRQIPFAMSKAINNTATQFQDAMRRGIASRFILRRPNFILNTVKIARGNFATKTKMTATVSIGGSEEKNRRGGILARFEEGREKRTLDPYHPIAVPTREVRASPAELPPRNLYPKNLRLVGRRGVEKTIPANIRMTRRGVEQIKGKQRTFVLDPSKHHGAKIWGVWQRYGPERGQLRLLWIYKMAVKIPKRLQFRETAQRTVPAQFNENFKLWLGIALRTARR